jgi:formiminotetrahydrofolate cyclodeaminase
VSDIEALATAIASPAPAPAAGAAIGAVTALAAALVEKACALTGGGALAAEREAAGSVRAAALAFAELDERTFGGISRARKAGGDVEAAWADAARVPLDLAESCVALSSVAASIAERANPNLRGEVDTAILLADAASLAAARLAEIDLALAGTGYEAELARLDAVRRRR